MPLITKVQWQCRRGTKELDLLLQHYLQTQYVEASNEEKALFTHLLTLEDDELSAYLLGENLSDSDHLTLFINNIKKRTPI